MGSDIHGWLEVGGDLDGDGTVEYWQAAVNLGTVVNRSYGFFGSMFGVRNYANFEPVAADRGLPEHLSRTVERTFPDREASDGDYHSHTWLGYDERIDWWQTARIDQPERYGRYEWDRATRTHKYTLDGELLEQNVSLSYSDGGNVLSDEQFETLKRERRVAAGGCRYESYPMTRYEAAIGNWYPLVRWAQFFEHRKHYEPDEIRFVVWFDS